jgi:hypothetical protein
LSKREAYITNPEARQPTSKHTLRRGFSQDFSAAGSAQALVYHLECWKGDQ